MERFCAAGDSRARSAANFLAIADDSFSSQMVQMFIVESVGNAHALLVPTFIAGLVATDQQDRRTSRIECVQDAKGSTLMLNPQFAHVAMPGKHNSRAMWKRQGRTSHLEEANGSVNRLLFCFTQVVPPGTEFVSEFNLPQHCDQYAFYGIFRQEHKVGLTKSSFKSQIVAFDHFLIESDLDY
jgi:hypothetical protein